MPGWIGAWCVLMAPSHPVQAKGAFIGSVVAMLLAAWLRPRSKRPVRGVVLLAASAAGMSCLALSGSRGAIVAGGYHFCCRHFGHAIDQRAQFGFSKVVGSCCLAGGWSTIGATRVSSSGGSPQQPFRERRLRRSPKDMEVVVFSAARLTKLGSSGICLLVRRRKVTNWELAGMREAPPAKETLRELPCMIPVSYCLDQPNREP